MQGERSIQLYCGFADGFTARGCHVVVHLFDAYTNSPGARSFNIPAEVGTECFELHPFTTPLRVEVYDWKWDDSVGLVSISPKHATGSPNMSCEQTNSAL